LDGSGNDTGRTTGAGAASVLQIGKFFLRARVFIREPPNGAIGVIGAVPVTRLYLV
jgi:hypothetical protein